MKTKLLAFSLAISLMLSCVPAYAAGEAETETPSTETGEVITKPEETTGPEESEQPKETTPSESEQPKETDPAETEQPKETDPAETEQPKETDPAETEQPKETDPVETEEPEQTGPSLITEPHVAYISGTGNGQVSPSGVMTRAEAAQILYNLASSKELGEEKITFSDVSEGAWYYTAVQYLASWGISKGPGDGTFRPNAKISRAEFVTLLSAFFQLEEGPVSFSDVSESYWGYAYIASAVAKGWVSGYTDGTFRPSQAITRAEAVHIVNASLNRTASHSEEIIEAAALRPYWDMYSTKWYYYDMLEATVSHEYSYETGVEVWTSYTTPDCGYDAGWVRIGPYLYHVNENLQFDEYEEGYQTINGASYYVNSNGQISALRTDSHIAYISGTGNGLVEPEGSMTRSEAAQILYNLSSCQEMGSKTVSFSDVSSDAWYYTAVQTLASWGVISGYTDGTFRPSAQISRAEFISMLSGYFELAAATVNFSDVPTSYWAYSKIASAVAKGWISGDADGAFYPARAITRAEAIHAVNAALNRTAANSKDTIDAAGIRQYRDLDPSKWYYYDVLEATVAHEYSYETGAEVWTSFTMPTSGYAQGFQSIGGKAYYVNSSGQFSMLAEGLQEVNGELVYAQADGSLLANASYNYLWFGSDGCYTTGSDELDDLVDAALAECTDSSMSQAEKLRAAYLWVRDNNKYLSRSHHSRGSTDWTIESATFMLTYNRGNCYCFAGTFLYMARRLGYDTAYPVSGGVGYRNSDHAWVMITQSNGVNYIYDVELEYAYRYRYSPTAYYNLYQMQRGSTPFVYHFPS